MVSKAREIKFAAGKCLKEVQIVMQEEDSSQDGGDLGEEQEEDLHHLHRGEDPEEEVHHLGGVQKALQRGEEIQAINFEVEVVGVKRKVSR